MMLTGKIANYDAMLGAGFIFPDAGGARLPFARADLHRPAYIPQEDYRFSYEPRSDGVGDCRATNLHKA